jgi:arylsulfatase A-like enzyme
MSEKTIATQVRASLLLGLLLWGVGAFLFGLIEAMVNSSAGLFLPLSTWAFAVGVYSVLGLLGGVVGGLVAVVWRNLPFLPRARTRPLVGALFLGGLVFVFIGLPLNERVLPDLISVEGLIGNAIFGVVAGALTLLFYILLDTRRGPGPMATFVNLVVFVSLALAVGDHLDVFVQPLGLSVSGLAPYLILLGVLVGLYLLVRGALRSIALDTGNRMVSFVILGLVAVLAIGLVTRPRWSAGSPSGPVPTGKPNVLWMVMDTTRADHLSAYGYEKPTSPVLEELAAEGALFEEVHAESSWTIPGHFVMVTGRFDAAQEKFLGEEFTTAAEVFRDGGYETAAVLGNMSIGRGSGFEQGFGSLVDGPVRIFYLSAFEKIPVIKILLGLGIAPPEAVLRLLHRKTFLQNEAVRADRINDDTLDWLDRRDPERPFFLFLNYMDPHDAYDPPADFRAQFAPEADPELGFVRYRRELGGTISSNQFVRDVAVKLDDAKWDEMLELYDAEIAYLDAKIGELLDELEARGLDDETIIVITSDHGELFGEHGLANHFKALTREETHVPLLIRYPGRIAPGTKVAAPAQLRDILPTVFELAGMDGAPEMDGQSLVPLLDGGTVALRDGATVGFLYRPVDKEYDFTSPGHLLSLREPGAQYVWSSTGEHEFYDLEVDPAAAENQHGEHQGEEEVRERFEVWREEAGFSEFGGKQKKLDRLMQDKLKALGYLN